MKIQPFFAQFLESQKLSAPSSAASKPPVMQTMAYPSDSDTDTSKLFTKLRLDVYNGSGLEIKDANPPATPSSPGNVVTLRYPSDSDSQDLSKIY